MPQVLWQTSCTNCTICTPQVLWPSITTFTTSALFTSTLADCLHLQVDAFLDGHWGTKRLSKAASEVRKNLEDGTHDSQIAEWLGLTLDTAAPATSARKRKRNNSSANEGDTTPGFKPKSNSAMTVDTISAANKGKHYGIVWQAWWKKYAVSLQNPSKQAEEVLSGEIANFQFPDDTHYVATGNAADLNDWNRILEAAKEKGVLTDESEVVIFGSPPWGALESNRSPYLVKADASASEYKDTELTDTQIGSFGSHACTSTPERAVMVLHLPPLDLGKYAKILEAQGWKVLHAVPCAHQTVLQRFFFLVFTRQRELPSRSCRSRE